MTTPPKTTPRLTGAETPASPKTMAAVITAAMVFGLAGVSAPVSLGVVFGGVVIVGVLEERLARRFSGA